MAETGPCSINMDYTEVILKQSEIIEELTKLNVEIIQLLSQYTSCEKYENKLGDITSRT